MRAWWRYGTAQWGARDYLRHFGFVAATTFAVTWLTFIAPLFHGGGPK